MNLSGKDGELVERSTHAKGSILFGDGWITVPVIGTILETNG